MQSLFSKDRRMNSFGREPAQFRSDFVASDPRGVQDRQSIEQLDECAAGSERSGASLNGVAGRGNAAVLNRQTEGDEVAANRTAGGALPAVFGQPVTAARRGRVIVECRIGEWVHGSHNKKS